MIIDRQGDNENVRLLLFMKLSRKRCKSHIMSLELLICLEPSRISLEPSSARGETKKKNVKEVVFEENFILS